MASMTAADLIASGARPQTSADRLRGEVLRRLKAARDDGASKADALASLFPNVVLEQETLEGLAAGLLSGAHVLLLGPPGAGKTTLAKAIWELMPKEVLAVEGSPLLDDPFSLVDPEWAKIVPPSPVALHMYGDATRPGHADPKDVPVVKVQLREGHGLARVQGSPEVFPDNLTGTVNLARLEEIGDPNSPLVLEPGKVLQAHRGLLLVDEVGKLPRGTQNVLLQALQERIATPARSRETFPADMVAITTSNVHDLGNITEPLTDRLANVTIDFPTDPAQNRRIADIGLGKGNPVPGPYRDAAVRMVMQWRATSGDADDLGEVGSNRALVDGLRRAWSHSLLSGDRLDADDLRRGMLEAMVGRIRARSADGFAANRDRVQDFVAEHWKATAREGAQVYWCRFFEDDLSGDKSTGTAVVHAIREAANQDPGAFESALKSDEALQRFARFVASDEGVEDATRVVEAARALEAFGAFDGDA